MSELVRLEQLIGQAESIDSWTPTNLNALPDTPPIEPTLGGTGILYPGKRHVFSGPPESAKTLAAYAALIVVARQAPAILIDFEMGARDAKKRLQELGADTTTLDRISYLEPDEPATPARLAALVDLQPELVVIDAAAGAYQIEGYDDNKRSDVERFSRLYVGAFWLKGIATIVIDHVVKSVEGRGKFVIGSERKLGSSDVHLGFDTIQPISRGTSGRYKITTHKDRGGCLKRGHLADLNLASDPDTHQISWSFTEPQSTVTEAGYFRPTHLMEKVSIYLETQPDSVTRNTVYEALGGTKAFLLKAIAALISEHYVVEEAGPNRSRPIRSINRYRENDESASQTNGSTMPAEPPNQLPPQTKTSESANLAQPCGGSVVRVWFDSGSRTTQASGGSVVRPPYGDDTTRPPSSDHQKPVGWFGANGTLVDNELAWLESIAPEYNPDADPNP